MIENELSYLVATMPDLAGLKKKEIEQHYISERPSPLRIRGTDGERFELTKKLPVADGDLSRKDELNIPLTPQEFGMLRPLSKKALQKTRYLVPLAQGLIAELDVFHGPLEGLVMVEVEFSDDARRAAFVPPAWFGRDISQEEWSTNAWLAGKTFEEVKGHL